MKQNFSIKCPRVEREYELQPRVPWESYLHMYMAESGVAATKGGERMRRGGGRGRRKDERGFLKGFPKRGS